MSVESLPRLIDFDLNDDGSVTLMLSDTVYMTGVVCVAPDLTWHGLKADSVSAEFPGGGEPDTLSFKLVNYKGERFTLRAAAENALSVYGTILSHLRRLPKFRAAVFSFLHFQAA